MSNDNKTKVKPFDVEAMADKMVYNLNLGFRSSIAILLALVEYEPIFEAVKKALNKVGW